jgi:hypothetical protein
MKHKSDDDAKKNGRMQKNKYFYLIKYLETFNITSILFIYEY